MTELRRARPTFRQAVGWTGFALVALLTLAVWIWRGDILRAGLDPQQPFQTYVPPPAPDYRRDAAWALNEARAPGAGDTPVFFLHPTTFDGGRDWLAPVVTGTAADRQLINVALPNYAGPFAILGPVSAPRYRQASLYTRLTLREDALEARTFAYRDARAAFETWLARHPQGPLVLVGVEQGGELLDRLVRDHPGLRDRLVAVYLLETLTPADPTTSGLAPCRARDQAGCLVAYASLQDGDEANARRKLRRALTWTERDRLEGAAGRAMLCVNPVVGAEGGGRVDARRQRGGANATDLEWGVRPGLIGRAVATECRDGVLWRSAAESESFRPTGSWADRRKVNPFNLFYGDLQSDAQTRLAAWRAAHAG